MAGCKLSDLTQEMTYKSVLSRNTVRIFLTIGVFNDLSVTLFDIKNSYINAYIYKKV